VIVVSGMNAARRIAARSYARSLGIELQSLPKPVDLAALRILPCQPPQDRQGPAGDAHPGRRHRRRRDATAPLLTGGPAGLAARAGLKRFQAKWAPVRVKKTRQIKNLEPRFDSIETEKALAALIPVCGVLVA
jgi:hypothetical protein